MSHNSVALFGALVADLIHHANLDEVPAYPGKGISPMYVGATPSVVAARSLLTSAFKKLEDEVDRGADRKAIDLFLACNKQCTEWVDRSNTSHDEVLVGEFKKLVNDFWNPNGLPLVSSFGEIWSAADVGPGVGLMATGTDFYSKMFSSPLSTTSKGLALSYDDYVQTYPEWQNAELIRKTQYGEACIVQASKLSCVPKRRDISRTICVEPTLNMFGQLGFGNRLRERLKAFFGLDLEVQQDRNRELARRGSMDGSFSTIDLSSASDTISLKMLTAMLPRDFMSWLRLLRCGTTMLPDGSHVALDMVSTMGNGFTFPLQTMLFACAVGAAARARGKALVNSRGADLGTWGVYGDDIIVPMGFIYRRWARRAEWYGDEVARDVNRLLFLLGFEVNASKSFSEGPFRESCGGDFYLGRDVRGVYFKSLRTMESRYVAINRLQKWSVKTGIPLPRAIAFLKRFVRDIPVPPWENDDAGVHTYDPASLKLRCAHDEQSILYRRRVAVPECWVVGESSIDGGKGTIYNVSGLFLSFLRGSIRNCKISIRSRGERRYRTVWAVAPHWVGPGPNTKLAVTPVG